MAYGQLVVVGVRKVGLGRVPALYVQSTWLGRAALPALRVAMGALVGLVFGLACGNMAFWLAAGAGMGGVFQALLPAEALPVSNVLCLPAPVSRYHALPAYPGRSRPLSIREAA